MKLGNGRHKQKGAAMIEYGLIVAFIALAVVTGVTLVGQNTSTIFDNVAGQF